MLAIPIGTLRALRYMRPHHLTVKWDGGERTFRTVQLTVANSNRFGGVVENPQAALDDDMLDLYSIDIRNWWDVLEVVAAVVRKQFPASRNITTIHARSFTVTSRHRHHVSADGEGVGMTPVEFKVVPRALEILVPAEACPALAEEPARKLAGAVNDELNRNRGDDDSRHAADRLDPGSAEKAQK